jgi:hypothetical protein
MPAEPSPHARKASGDALRVFLEMLPDPTLRAKFAADPLAYFQAREVAVADLPTEVHALFDHPLALDELKTLAGATDNLKAAKLVDKRPNEPGGFATLCKF